MKHVFLLFWKVAYSSLITFCTGYCFLSQNVYNKHTKIFIKMWWLKNLLATQKANKSTINLARTDSDNTCPLYSNFFFNLTITNRLLSAVVSNKGLTSTCSTGILHNAPLSFGDWSFGMIVTFLNNSLFEIRTLSSFPTLLNCSGKQLTASLLQTA